MVVRQQIFPALSTWPPAIKEIDEISQDATKVRLVAGAKNFQKLGSFTRLKALWCFDINNVALEGICNCVSLESLFVENLKTANVDCLGRLRNLSTLSLDSCSKIASLEFMANLPALSGLAIIHFKNVHDLTPLAALTHLKQLDIANFYPMREFAQLSGKLQTTECAWFRPFVSIKSMSCKKCGKHTMIMLTGKKYPILCTACDAAKLGRHIEQWNQESAPRA